MEKLNFSAVKQKNKVIDDCIKTLKSEFVGIDVQIDNIMNNVRTWYLFPELQNRPLVINLWGMSGIGKTSLVKRIVQLLNIERDLVYFNFAAISESSSWEIEDQIETELSNEKSNRVFVYDEFQYARTINKSAEEIEKKGLKPFWELLDSGLIHKRCNYWTVRNFHHILTYIKTINKKTKMRLVNGIWVNANECLVGFEPYDVQQYGDFFSFHLNKNESPDGIGREVPRQIVQEMTPATSELGACNGVEDDCIVETISKDFFIRSYYLEKMFELYTTINTDISDKITFYHYLAKMNIDEFVDFLNKLCQSARKGYDLTFNDSIIFVIGNLDEAYEISFDVNPDMSPDQFRKITEEITDVDIKGSLRRRFRNEQIARLGNIHVVYPSFSSQNFKDLITLNLNSYAKEAKELCGYDLEFKDSLKDIVYSEGVYPTHGTRPIFSTIHELVKSFLPSIVEKLTEKKIHSKTTLLSYGFDNETDELIIDAYKKDELLDTVRIHVNLRLKKLRESKKDDQLQAICALHESGHFVMYGKLFNNIPEKLVSRTTTPNTGGFLMEDVDKSKKKHSKQDMINEICVLLGGYVAEKTFFGEDRLSNGASSDLSRATAIAANIVRWWGMGTMPYVSPSNINFAMGDDGRYVYEDNQNSINMEIKQIIERCMNEVRATFENAEWRKMLKSSAQYLCVHSSMPQEEMKVLLDSVPNNVKIVPLDEKYYHNRIDSI